ncbi:hypothetical protein BOX15_Mlig022145g1 [Macrostomum lignano]|uniref:Adenylyltransferase and sulfurtransferase MOCS3 homolog n=1 Tax=Macrostomum lignano TaxID=282301 RepID=A0A267GF97_9PLAT|nr:hypothetical protein BOX15_Mlig022145g1 [Macrostomum lignano]
MASKDSAVAHSLTNPEISRYSRQLIMPEIGVAGQMALKSSRVLIIGAGGLGCPAAIYLAAAGVGHIGIVDHDNVELSNLHRQILHTESAIGTPKAVSAAEQCRRLNSSITLEPITEKFTNKVAMNIVSRFDLVLDCTDNVATRYLINDACVLAGKPLVSGAALGFEGQLCVYNHRGGPCYRCLHPAPPPPETVVSCAEGGVLGLVPGIIGSMQALEAVKVILQPVQAKANLSATGTDEQQPPQAPKQQLRLFNALESSLRCVAIRKRSPGCEVCGREPRIVDVRSVDYEAFCGLPACDLVTPRTPLPGQTRISATEFAKVYNAAGSSPTEQRSPRLLLDVRPECEFAICRLRGSLNVPLSRLAQPVGKSLLAEALQPLLDSSLAAGDASFCDKDKLLPVYVICRRGNDSQVAVRILQEQLADRPCRLIDIAGGLTAWAAQVDREFPIY